MGRFMYAFFILFSHAVLAFDWQGHRGARGLYPENTIGGMEEALKYPVTTLEMDVVLSKDNTIVVSHEPWMSSEICVNPKGKDILDKTFNLYQMNFSEIQAFDCGSRIHARFPKQKKVTTGKPSLGTLIDFTEKTLKHLNRQSVAYNIEIKSTPADENMGFQPDVKTFSDVVVTFLLNRLPVEKFSIQSFDWRVLQYIHKTYPQVRLVALVENTLTPEENLKELGFRPWIYSPDYKTLTKEQVSILKSLGIKVIPWTVNTIQEMNLLIEMKVDGIITDYPDLIPQVGSKKCGSKESLFEGKCVRLPQHALPSDKNPGWVCAPKYIQKRNRCIKIKLPPHSHLLDDGKTWECKPGYKRYRSTCRKE